MVHQVVAPSTSTSAALFVVATVVAAVVVALLPDRPLRLHTLPALRVSAPPALALPSLASPVAPILLLLALLVWLFLATPLGLRLGGLHWFQLHSVATLEIALRHLC